MNLLQVVFCPSVSNPQKITYRDKPYMVVAGKHVSATEANSLCRTMYNGSLASVTTQYLFDGITEQLATVTAGKKEGFWVCGKVEGWRYSALGVIGLTPPPSFQQGKSRLAKRSKHRIDRNYQIYPTQAYYFFSS